MIQMTKAAELRRDWAAKGNPPCDHPHTDREYALSSHTGDRVCTTCGETWSDNEWRARGRQG